eukprot:TRINITY_DN17814_c0_g1_i1.p2 TRINITY_DN17814_c0_g1~~TRINITY_DN17814_c0_g1_i1.p2  ORF type:complete len:106 (-),score=6.50 TRINITY_DN17814_c0_g1_i1:369-686(-)
MAPRLLDLPLSLSFAEQTRTGCRGLGWGLDTGTATACFSGLVAGDLGKTIQHISPIGLVSPSSMRFRFEEVLERGTAIQRVCRKRNQTDRADVLYRLTQIPSDQS